MCLFLHCCVSQRGCNGAERRLNLLTWYSSGLSPAAVATCSSCAGVCFLKILCSKTKISADSGEVCSSTAKPPYLKQYVFTSQMMSLQLCHFNENSNFTKSNLPSSPWHVMCIHLLLWWKQTEGLSAVERRYADIIRQVVLRVHHLHRFNSDDTGLW